MANSALIEDLEKQFAENPRRVFARLANEYRKSGHLDSAIEICRKQVPLQPTYISGYIVLGQALFDSAQFDEARTTFETALGLDPENLIALRQLGDIARAAGDAEGARAWYRRLLDVDPQNDEIAEQLRELEASAGAPSREAVSWSDINPEQHAATAEGAAPSAPALELPALELSPAFPDIAAFAPPPAPPAPPARQAPSAPAPLDLDLDALADSPVADAADSPRMPEPAAHARAAGDLDTIDGLEFPSADEIAGSEPSATEQLERAAAAIDLDFAPGASAAPPLPWNDGAAEKDRALEPEALAELDLAFDAPAPGEAPPPPVHAEHRREPELEPVEESAPAAFVTETMAELYLRQGFADRALGIYRQLLAQRPGDAALRERIARLERGDLPPRDAASAPRSMRAFFAGFASRRPPAAESMGDVDAPIEGEAAMEQPAAAAVEAQRPSGALSQLFGGQPVSVGDEQAASAFAAAFSGSAGSGTAIAGQPARAANDALSLSDVFGDARQRGGEGQSRPAASVSFDEFYARGEGSATAGGSPEAAAHDADGEASGDKDLELFHAWLEGLKK